MDIAKNALTPLPVFGTPTETKYMVIALYAFPKLDVIGHSISNRFFQCFSYIIDRVHQNSSSMHFRRPNTDLGGLIRIQEGQYRFRRANMEPSVHFRKANTEQSVHFRRANTETY